jgi:hypothetical protein
MESMGVADIIRQKNTVANLNHQSIIKRRHYPIILHGFKHIGVMETPENVVDEDGGDGAWEHP